nr:hypothetical protein [uncultured Campylobacter sp.]
MSQDTQRAKISGRERWILCGIEKGDVARHSIDNEKPCGSVNLSSMRLVQLTRAREFMRARIL